MAYKCIPRNLILTLQHSPLLLLGTLVGMLLTYMVPPAAAITGATLGLPVLSIIGLVAWAIMAFTLIPTLRFYDQPWWLAPLLPLSALLYSGMTFDSAAQHWRGQGGSWKGRSRGRQT